MYLATNNCTDSEQRTYFAEYDKETREVVLKVHKGHPLSMGVEVVFEERFTQAEAVDLMRCIRGAVEASVHEAHAASALAEAERALG